MLTYQFRLLTLFVMAIFFLTACQQNLASTGSGPLTISSQNEAANENSTIIALDPQKKYQTINGWEVTAQAGQAECRGFDLYKDQVFDLAVNDLGINRVRLELRSGAENPVDYFSQFASGEIDFDGWRPHRYEIINDNADPNLIRPEGFQFSELEHTIENVILPLKQRLEANGEQLYINLTVVDFNSGQGASNVQYQVQPEEYAELVLAAFLHMNSQYGLLPDAVEVILEPDVAGWSAEQTGRALTAVAKQLERHKFTPEFIAPSNTDMGNALNYFDQMVQMPEVLNYLSTISYHRYGGVSENNLEAIAARAVQYGLNTAMLEHIGSGYQDLHQDLKIGLNSAWQQFTLSFCSADNTDNGGTYFPVNTSDPDHPVVNIGQRTKFLSQYFRFVRPGAVRIEAKSDNLAVDPLAFTNSNGSFVVILKADRGSSFSISGLPAGTYGVNYTTDAAYNVDAPDISLQSSQALNAQIPAAGVVTIYPKGD